mgnify:CR=1 FL=1
MKIKPKPLSFLVIIAALFGILSLVFGIYLLLYSPLLGIVGVIFGIIDLVAAFLYWKTGRLSWFILLFGPIVFIPAVPTSIQFPEALGITFIVFLFPFIFFIAAVAIFFWISSRFTSKMAVQVREVACKKCEAILPKGYKYCPFCGEPVKHES